MAEQVADIRELDPVKVVRDRLLNSPLHLLTTFVEKHEHPKQNDQGGEASCQ